MKTQTEIDIALNIIYKKLGVTEHEFYIWTFGGGSPHIRDRVNERISLLANWNEKIVTELTDRGEILTHLALDLDFNLDALHDYHTLGDA